MKSLLDPERVREALAGGCHQGRDPHPAQLPSRYAGTCSFARILESRGGAAR